MRHFLTITIFLYSLNFPFVSYSQIKDLTITSTSVNPHKFNDYGFIIFSLDVLYYTKMGCTPLFGECYFCKETVNTVSAITATVYLSTTDDLAGDYMEISNYDIFKNGFSTTDASDEQCTDIITAHSFVDILAEYTIPCRLNHFGYKYLILEIKEKSCYPDCDDANTIYKSYPVLIDNFPGIDGYFGDYFQLPNSDFPDVLTVTAPYSVFRPTNVMEMINGFDYSGTSGNIFDAYIEDCPVLRTSKPDDNTKTNSSMDSYYQYPESIIKQNSKTSNSNRYLETSPKSEIKNQKFILSIVPNPSSSGIFTIAADNNISSVTVTNVLGEIIYEITVSITSGSFHLNISTQPKGIYFVQIQNGEEISVQKIVYQ